jgi:hypothetical protein
VSLAPRWITAGIDSVNVTIHFPASNGYVTYHYKHNSLKKEINFRVTGSGNTIQNHILLPGDCRGVESVTVDDQIVDYRISKIENSLYADFPLSLPSVHEVKIIYK